MLLKLQRSAGNAAVARLLSGGPVLARADTAAPPAPRTHVVESGESLDILAERFGVTIDELVEPNKDKLKRWSTPKGERVGFNAGETIVVPGEVPAPAPAPPAAEPEEGVRLDPLGAFAEWAWSTWTSWFPEHDMPVPAPEPSFDVPKPEPAPPEMKTPIEVIDWHEKIGTFGQDVTVTSTKRDGGRQVGILRGYCNANRAAIDAYAESTPWLTGALDWEAFQTATLADEDVYLPFFFALYWAGGGPGVDSDDRTLPLVGSPVQSTWTDQQGTVRTANASPHLAGRAMDVDAADLEALNTAIKTKVPEFSDTGPFPMRSSQPENAPGQTVVHITFKSAHF